MIRACNLKAHADRLTCNRKARAFIVSDDHYEVLMRLSLVVSEPPIRERLAMQTFAGLCSLRAFRGVVGHMTAPRAAVLAEAESRDIDCLVEFNRAMAKVYKIVMVHGSIPSRSLRYSYSDAAAVGNRGC